MSRPVVVLGGGISGLATAYYLNSFCRSVIGKRKIIVLEAAKRLGGYIQTDRSPEGVIHELGPRSLRNDGRLAPHTFELVDRIGLSSEVIGKSSVGKQVGRKYIWADGRLVQVPNSTTELFTKRPPILNKSLFRYAIAEFRKPRLPVPDYQDISIYDFFRLRYDDNFAEYLADPLVRGITAGDARKLSMKALFHEMYHCQDVGGSLLMGMYKKVQSEVPLHYEVSDIHAKAKMESWSTWSFLEGLQRLPDGLSDYLVRQPSVQLCNESRVKSISFNQNGVPALLKVSTEQDEIELEADYLISSLSAQQLASLLPENLSSIAHKLSKIEGTHVGVVCLEYGGKSAIPRDLGFGFLTPSFEDSKILGITFDSCIFPEHDYNKDITRLTVMMGGEWFVKLFGPPDSVSNATLETVAVEACHKHLGIAEKPRRSIVRLYKNSIPQYRLNHRTLVSQIEDEISERSLSLSLTGFSYKGIAVNECIYNAKKLGMHLYESRMNGREQFSSPPSANSMATSTRPARPAAIEAEVIGSSRS